MSNGNMEEALRQTHCARAGEGHACAGTVTIGPRGTELSCPLCGSGPAATTTPDRQHFQLAATFASRLGVEFDCLSTETQIAAALWVQRLVELGVKRRQGLAARIAAELAKRGHLRGDEVSAALEVDVQLQIFREGVE